MAAKKSYPKTVKALQSVLADSFTLYLKTHNFHWHVEGPDFAPMHDFLETLYKDLWAALDEIAERIRQLDAQAAGSMKEYTKLTCLNEAKGQRKSKDMVKALLADHVTIIGVYQKALKASEQEGDVVTNDFVIERMAYHEKIVWMLKAMS